MTINAKQINVLDLLTVEQCKEAIASHPEQAIEILERVQQLASSRKAAPKAPKSTADFLAGCPGDIFAYFCVKIAQKLDLDIASVEDMTAVAQSIPASFGLVQTAQGGARQKTQALRNLLALGVVTLVDTPALSEDNQRHLDAVLSNSETIQRYVAYFKATNSKEVDNAYSWTRGNTQEHDQAFERLVEDVAEWYKQQNTVTPAEPTVPATPAPAPAPAEPAADKPKSKGGKARQ